MNAEEDSMRREVREPAGWQRRPLLIIKFRLTTPFKFHLGSGTLQSPDSGQLRLGRKGGLVAIKKLSLLLSASCCANLRL